MQVKFGEIMLNDEEEMTSSKCSFSQFEEIFRAAVNKGVNGSNELTCRHFSSFYRALIKVPKALKH